MSEPSAQSILVIDDDEVFRRRLARAFRDRGLVVGEASKGSEACAYVLERRPELAVLDLKLGEESGLAVLQELRSIDRDLKVVVLTGYGTIATAVEAVKAGAVNYLSKPTDADTVLSAFEDRQIGPAEISTPRLEQVEWDHIQRVVTDFGGNISQASKALGLHRRSLQRKLTKSPRRLR